MPKPNVTHQIRIDICADDFFDLTSPRPGGPLVFVDQVVVDSGRVDVTIVPRERLVLYEVTYWEDDGDANEERRLLFDNAADARAAAEWVKSTESFLSSPDEIYVTNITGQVRSSWSDPEPADAELLFGLRMDTATEGGE